MNKNIINVLCVVLACLMLCGCRPAPEGGSAVSTDAAAERTPAANESEPAGQTAAPAAQTEAPHEEKFYVVDYDRRKICDSSQNICETDDSFYYLTTEDRILFTDKNYKSWMPLCGKPECSHSSRERNCNACLEGDTLCIWIYGEHLYYAFMKKDYDEVTSFIMELWRMKLDGSDHELVTTLEYEDLGAAPTMRSYDWVFHNKYMFVEKITSAKRSLLYVDLSRPEEGLKELAFKLDGGEETVGIMCMLYAEGDIIYSTEKAAGKTLYKLNMADRTATTLCTLPFEGEDMRCCSFIDGKLCFCNSWYEGIIVNVDAETGEMEIVNTAEPEQTLWRYPLDEYIIGSYPNYEDGVISGLIVYDMQGNELQRVPFEEAGPAPTIRCIFGHYALGYLGTNDMTRWDIIDYPSIHAPNWYIDLNDIGTDNLMWRSWEPED